MQQQHKKKHNSEKHNIWKLKNIHQVNADAHTQKRGQRVKPPKPTTFDRIANFVYTKRAKSAKIANTDSLRLPLLRRVFFDFQIWKTTVILVTESAGRVRFARLARVECVPHTMTLVRATGCRRFVCVCARVFRVLWPRIVARKPRRSFVYQSDFRGSP